MWHDMGWHGMWFGWLFWIVIVILIVWVFIRFMNRYKSNQTPDIPDKTPLDILKKRYAKGEITKEQFEQMKKDLQEK